MDIAVKKIDLINWLSRLQDEALIKKIETLRKSSVKSVYESRMTENLESKLARSEADIQLGRIHSHEKVKAYFKAKGN